MAKKDKGAKSKLKSELLDSVGKESPHASNDAKTAQKKLADFFHHHRVKSGMSLQVTAAALVGLDAQALARLESGLEPWPLDHVFALTNILNISPEETLALIFDTYGSLKNS